MSYDSIDYQRIRARTEQRIMPLLRLYRRRIWLFGHIVAFLLLNWYTPFPLLGAAAHIGDLADCARLLCVEFVGGFSA